MLLLKEPKLNLQLVIGLKLILMEKDKFLLERKELLMFVFKLKLVHLKVLLKMMELSINKINKIILFESKKKFNIKNTIKKNGLIKNIVYFFYS